MTEDVPAPGAPKRVPLAIALPLLLVLGMGSAIALYRLAPELFRPDANDPRSGGRGLGAGKVVFLDLPSDPTGYDFGLILDGEHETHTFAFENRGEDPVAIREMNVPCDCTKVEEIGSFGPSGERIPVPATVKRDYLTLPPGGRGYLTLRVFPSGMTRATEVRHSTLVLETDSASGPSVFLRYRATFKALVNVAWRKVGDEILQAVRTKTVNIGFLTQSERASYQVDFVPISHQPYEFKEAPTLDGRPLEEAPDYLHLEVVDAEELGVPRKRIAIEVGGVKPLGIRTHVIRAVAHVDGHDHVIEATFQMGVLEDVFLRTAGGERDRAPRLDFGDLEPRRAARMQREVQYVGTLPDFRFERARIEIEGEPIEARVDVESLGGGRFLVDLELPRGTTRSFVGEVVLEASHELPSGTNIHRIPVRGRVPPGLVAAPAPANAGPARCRIDRPVRSLGTILHRSTPVVSFPIENPGATPLELRSVTSTQAVPLTLEAIATEHGEPRMLPRPPPTDGTPWTSLEPGFRGELLFRLDTNPVPQARGAFDARAVLRTNDPITPEVFVSARGIAQRPVHLYQAYASEAPRPVEALRLGHVGRTQELVFAAELHPTLPVESGFVTTVVREDGTPLPDFLAVDVDYDAIGELPIARLTFHLRSERPLGALSIGLEARVQHAEGTYPCRFAVEATVIEDLARVAEVVLEGGPADAVAPPPVIALPIPLGELELGPVRPGQAFRHRERLWYLGAQRAFRVDSAPTWRPLAGRAPEGFAVEVLPPDGEHPHHRLSLHLPEGTAEPFRIAVSLATNAPDLPKVDLPVAFRTEHP